MKNRVNYLDGKNWLKNAVNFYEFEDFEIDKIQERFYNLCYKKRTTGSTLLYYDSQKVGDYDFTFRCIENLDELNKQFEIIYHSSYNSYHIVLLHDIIFEEDLLISKYITDFVTMNKLEYRGKVIVYCKSNNSLHYAFMILNRIDKSNNQNYQTPQLNDYHINSNIGNEYVIVSKSKIDKIGLKHPAPFSYIDINKIAEIENINNQTILDPFLGVGSTILGTYKSNYNIGIELNSEYIDLIYKRLEFLDINDLTEDKFMILNGDCLSKIECINRRIDCVITSPPYFNILKNKNKGVRHDNSQSRQGVEHYGDSEKDFGNISTYNDYLLALQTLFKKSYNKMNTNGNFYLIISDFTINKKETDIHSDMIRIMNNAGFTYTGTSYLYQNQKVIYPFGYPYKIVLNHIYQYVIKFEKE